VRIVDGFEIFLDIDLLVLEVFLEIGESTDPFLFDELVITCKLPGNELLGIFGSEVIVLVDQGLTDVFSFKHVFGFEFDREVR
jgi:hypothetical protein